MLNAFSEVSWLGVLGGTIAFAVLGGVWFTVLFGKAYAVALGRQADAPSPSGALFIVGPLLCGLVTVITSAVLMRALDIDSVGSAVLFGVIVGVGYLVAMTFNIAINPNFPRPLLYGVISGAYFLLASVIASIIIVLLS